MPLSNKSSELVGISFLLFALISGFVFMSYSADKRNTEELVLSFHNKQNEIMSSVEHALVNYQELFKGSRGLLAASDHVSRDEWKAYVDSLNLEAFSPGIRAFAYADLITKDERQDYIDNTHEEGFSDFKIYPESGLNISTPATYLEPFNDANQKVHGYDMWSEASRREAMTHAAENNYAVLTRRVTLVEDSQQGRDDAGFLLFLPAYKKGAAQKNSIDDVEGFIYGLFRVRNMLDPIAEKFPDIKIELFDGSAAVESGIMYESAVSEDVMSAPRRFNEFQDTRTLNIHHHAWTFRFTTLPSYGQGIDRLRPVFILLFGIAFSGICFFALWFFRRSKHYAELVATERTHDLAQSQARMNLIFEGAPDALIIVGEDGKIELVNAQTETLFGYERGELVGQAIEILIPDEFAKNHAQHRNKYLAAPRVRSMGRGMELRGKKKDESTFPVEISLSPLKMDDGTLLVSAAIRDITERKEAEDELRTANAELEEFAYRTSHDLRSPLVSGIALLKIVSRCVKDGNDEKALKSLDMTIASLDELVNLVGSILLLTRVKNDDEEDEEVDIKALIEDAIQKLEDLKNHQRLEIQTDLGFSGKIVTKKNRLQVIVENLLSNAVKYQDLGKDSSFVKISTSLDGNQFVLIVEDNGLGIPKQQQGKLFTMFKRFHPKAASGAGLGLYMAQKSADVLKGNVVFEETQDGSGFKVSIPYHEARAKAA